MFKSGRTSGTVARLLPVLTFDRDLIRLQSERLPQCSLSLQGLESAFIALESKFKEVTCGINESCVTLEFSRSTLLDNYRANNLLLTRNARSRNSDLGFVLTTLLNNAPPNAEALINENSVV